MQDYFHQQYVSFSKLENSPTKSVLNFNEPYRYICLCIGPGPSRANVADVWIGENLLLPVVMRRKRISPTKRAANHPNSMDFDIGTLLPPMLFKASCRLWMLKFRYKRDVKHLSSVQNPGWLFLLTSQLRPRGICMFLLYQVTSHMHDAHIILHEVDATSRQGWGCFFVG